MASTLHRLAAAAALAMAASCAHAPAPKPSLDVVWPEPPAAARARLAAIHPDRTAPRPRRPWWKVALELITGADRPEEERLMLVRPFSVAFAPDGSLYAADPDGARVVRIDGRGTLDDVACKDVPWSAPMAVALGPDGSLFVADAGAGEIVRWSERGCEALGVGALERPTGVAVAPDRIWVADPPRHQIVALSPGGHVVARIGEQGDGQGQFHFPTAVARAPDGDLLVVDALNFRVVRLGPDGSWRGAFGAAGDEGGAFARPKGIAVGAAGDVFVSDAQRDAVLVYAPDGTFRFAIGDTGTPPGRFTHPAGVATAPGLLAVADSHNRRIQVFALLGGSP
jgi:tripartite motif-containing protein 71